VDTWAMGVIMYTMLIGQPPFETSSVKTTYERIRRNTYEFPSHIAISPSARSLIERILSSSPNDRPSLTQMVQDPFFTQSAFPKQLPISCLNKPLDWKHAWHHPSASGGSNQENAQENAGMVSIHRGLAATSGNALTSRATNVPVGVSTEKKASLRPTPAGARAIEAKVASPPALHAPVKRLSSATPVDVHATATSTLANFPAPSPTYAAEPVHPKAFFKELLKEEKTNAPVIAVPVKRTSGGGESTRRSSRRSGDEKLADEPSVRQRSSPVKPTTEEQLTAGMRAMDLQPAAAAGELVQEEHGGADAEEDVEEVRKMHDEIERSFCTPAAAAASETVSTTRRSLGTTAASSTASSPLLPASLWVNKWVDYSNKYGLGYLLSNGSSGVYFNDSSKAILDKDGERWEYMERKAGAQHAGAEIDRQCYTMTEYPPALQKKVTLLKHFMNYLVPPAESAAATPPPSFPPSSTSSDASAPPRVYVKKWLRTKHAIFFRLSNRTVQVIFLDHTELVLSSQHNTVTYTDKNKKRAVFSLDRESGEAANTSDKPDLAKRMKYTKDILHHLLTHTQAKNASGEQTSEK
jgi:hypothetical protein